MNALDAFRGLQPEPWDPADTFGITVGSMVRLSGAGLANKRLAPEMTDKTFKVTDVIQITGLFKMNAFLKLEGVDQNFLDMRVEYFEIVRSERKRQGG